MPALVQIMSPIRRQAIIWTNDGLVCRYIYIYIVYMWQMSSVFSHESAQRNHLRVQHLHNCNHLRVQNGNANERETSYGSTLHLTKMSPLTLVDVFSNVLTYISMLDIHITGFSIEILWKCHIVVCQTWDQPSVVITIRSWGLRKILSPHDVPATVINLKTVLWKDTAREYNVLFTKQRSVPQIMPRNTTMVSLSQSSKVATLITNRLLNTPAREIRPSSPNTTGSCVIKVLIRRTSKLIVISSDKPINTSVAHKEMRPVSYRKACDSPSRQIYHAQQEIRDRISMPTQNQIQVS